MFYIAKAIKLLQNGESTWILYNVLVLSGNKWYNFPKYERFEDEKVIEIMRGITLVELFSLSMVDITFLEGELLERTGLADAKFAVATTSRDMTATERICCKEENIRSLPNKKKKKQYTSKNQMNFQRVVLR